MPLTYTAGSKAPVAADLSTLLALTTSSLTPNDLEVLLDAVHRKSYSLVAPGSQSTLGTLLP